MQLVDARWVHDSSDLRDLLACETRSRLLRAHTAGISGSPVPLDRTGSDGHSSTGDPSAEHAQLAEFRRIFGHAGVRTINAPSSTSPGPGRDPDLGWGAPEQCAAAADATAAALRDRTPVIHRAVLHNGSGYERVPFLVSTYPAPTIGEGRDHGSETSDAAGAHHAYEAWLVTATRHATPEDVLTLSAYTAALSRAGNATRTVAGPKMHLVLGDGQTLALTASDFAAVHHDVHARLLTLLAAPVTLPVPLWAPEQRACPSCPFEQHCVTERERSRDLSLVAGLRPDQARKLTAVGLRTLDDLANADDAARPATMTERAFTQLRDQARLQHAQDQTRTATDPVGKVTYRVTRPRALARVPAPTGGDLYATVGAEPGVAPNAVPQALTRLWALAHDVTDAPGATDVAVAAWWAVTAKQEKVAFEAFIDAITARLDECPDAHIYHFGTHTPDAMKRAAAVHGTREAEVDDVLRGGALIDLHAIVRNGLLISQRSTTLPHLEPLFRPAGFGLDAGAPDGSTTREVPTGPPLTEPGAVAAAPPEMARVVRRECASVRHLREWLTMLRDTTPGALDPDPDVIDAAAGERDDAGLDERAVARRDALTAEADLVAALHARDEAPLTVLAGSVGYYRREANPAWWDFFSQAATPLTELEVNAACVVPVSVHADDWVQPSGRVRNAKRQLRLRCDPDLPHPFTTRDTVRLLYPSDGAAVTTNGTVTQADAGSLEVLESVKPDQVRHTAPVAVLPGPPVSPAPKDTAVAMLAGTVADAAAAAPTRTGSAALDLLARRAPRLRSGGTLPPVDAGAGDVVATVVDAVDALDDSYLAVQGPPGAGKTYLATRLIEHLVGTGRTVGVCSTSHQAVENVLTGLDPAAVAVAKRPSGPPDPAHLWEQPRSNDALAGWRLAHPGGHVIGGTAWTFASSAVAHDPVDVLLIDEAGQFALTDVLAVSAAARNLVLLGDPQQLPQVVAGTHPGGVDASALGHLLDGAEIVPEHLGYFLDVSRRMHPAVCAPVSALSYQGLLHSHPTAASRGVAGVEPGLHYLPVEHHGNTTLAREEVAAVVETAAALIGREWTDQGRARPLRAGDVLVVAPFNRQVRALRHALDRDGLSEVRVGTVDKFQGQEAPVVITSLTASSGADLPRGIDFLLSRNRMNVALSRAQAVAVLVASPDLARTSVATVDQLRLVAGLLGLIAGAHPWQPTEHPE